MVPICEWCSALTRIHVIQTAYVTMLKMLELHQLNGTFKLYYKYCTKKLSVSIGRKEINIIACHIISTN